jgi:hypothetical protein
VTGGGRAGVNPVDDQAFTRPLIRELSKHVDRFAESIRPGRGGPRRASKEEEAAARSAAVAWVYTTCLVAWAEDHRLIDPWLRADAEMRRKEFLALPGMTMTAWLARAIAALCVHPGTWCLLDPRYNPLRDGTPTEEVIRSLVDWWSNDAPSLAYEADSGPASVTGWLAGDLLQALPDERREAAALCQTPWWIADFLLQLTLVPAAADWPHETLRLIDPACGTGHILTWAFIGLHHLYTTGASGGTPVSSAAAVRRALAGLHGVELEPLTAAVARLRLTVLAGALLANAGHVPFPLRLDGIPTWVRPNIAVGNALLAGQGDPCPPGTILDDTADYPGILDRGRYHAVVANPPYKTVKDRDARAAIRAAYSDVCVGRYSLSVPFAKLCFDLAIRGDDGHVATAPEQLDLLAGEAPT